MQFCNGHGIAVLHFCALALFYKCTFEQCILGVVYPRCSASSVQCILGVVYLSVTKVQCILGAVELFVMQFEAEEGSCSCCSFHFSLSSTPDQNKPVQLWVFDTFSVMFSLTNLINSSKQKRLGNVCCQVLCQATEFSGVWYVRMQFNLKFIAAVSNSHLLHIHQSYIGCIFVLVYAILLTPSFLTL